MHKLTRFSVNYPTTVMMMVLAILLLGIISFGRLGVDLLPDLNNPRLFVEIVSADRPPGEMERLYVTNVEAIVSRQSKVNRVSSVSRVGKALVTVEYSWDADMDIAFLDMQKSLAAFGQNDAGTEITVSQHDPNAAPVILVSMYHPDIDDLDQLRRTAENIVRNELVRLEGIAAVEIVGARQREVEILTDPYTLEAYGLTLDQVASRISSFNRNLSGGSIVEMGRRYVIKGVGEYQDLHDIENLIVRYKIDTSDPGGGSSQNRVPVYLREIATVRIVQSDPENIVRVNGRQCLGLEIFKERKFNTIDAVAKVREELQVLRQSLPGYQLSVIQDQGKFIRASVNEVEQTGLIGIILAVIVLYVFLRRIGVTAVISMAIPISVVATFNLMFFNDLSLNVMTLGGLALGAGMLVDNAIVVMENIFRHLEEGKPLREAAILGAGQVGGAITSSTLTTVIVFLPIVYLHGAAGELFREQAWTVAFSLISSLFVAILVIPMLASRFLKSSKNSKSTEAMHFPGYGSFVEKVIDKRKRVVLGGLVLVALTALLVPLVGSEFIPRSDQGEFRIDITLPEGTSLDRTDGTTTGIEGIITESLAGEIEAMYTRVGPSSSTTEDDQASLEDENNASVHVFLNPERDRSTADIIAMLHNRLKDFPDVEMEFVQQQTALQMTLGTDAAPLSVEIRGEDLDILAELADSAKERLETISDLMNIETSFERGRPEVNIKIDRTVAAQFSLSVDQIATQIRDLLSGREAGQMEFQGEYDNILIRRPDVSLSELSNVLIESSAGRRIGLNEVARIEYSSAPREIIRNNQARIARITAQIRGDKSFDRIVGQVEDKLKGIALPAKYSSNITGEEEMRREAFGNLGFALLLAIVLVYMVMAAQFESLIHPFVIILTLPLAAVGAVLALFVFGIPFNIMSYIGIIMLAGIAVNDSIILVDCINQQRRAGMTLRDAVIAAGQMRIRPILITSVTTILALLPLTIGIGEGASLRAPMAVAVIGGLITSTALTLVVIPAVYYILAGRSLQTEMSSVARKTND
ncbi:MAG: efflux RND transporter permease subunit [candidate division Zixibacteria bacterium]|nr:efflux RND transporter permease subunit [candidate division Zixibacteria bacterium]MBU1470815.1 efflux RND transporter permease subunit [candidate division Zixibacteria bacterium]MBU2625194.1 efflux RND transporter permease subunit [candidate division Zixibacteria bacterium]